MPQIEWNDGDGINLGYVPGPISFGSAKPLPSENSAAISIGPRTFTMTGKILCAHTHESLDIVHGVGLVRQCDFCHEITAKL